MATTILLISLICLCRDAYFPSLTCLSFTKRLTMIISNLNYLDTVSQESEIIGGNGHHRRRFSGGLAIAGADADATGRLAFSATYTSTDVDPTRRGFRAQSESASISAAIG